MSYLAWFLQASRQIYVKHIGDGGMEGHASKFPIQLRDVLAPKPLAVPVEAGMMFWAVPHPSEYSFPVSPSMVFWMAVTV